MSFNTTSGKYFRMQILLFFILLIFGWLLFAYAGVVYKSYKIDSKKAWFQTENDKLTLQNEQLSQQYEYFQTDGFMVREAKRKLNKREDKEKVLLLSELKPVNNNSAFLWHGVKNSTLWWKYFFGESVYE